MQILATGKVSAEALGVDPTSAKAQVTKSALNTIRVINIYLAMNFFASTICTLRLEGIKEAMNYPKSPILRVELRLCND